LRLRIAASPQPYWKWHYRGEVARVEWRFFCVGREGGVSREMEGLEEDRRLTYGSESHSKLNALWGER
jgi:hypothetical protein